MKEFIYSRNAVYETLRAHRRDVFRLEVAHGAQEKGRLLDILKMAEERKIPVLRAPRAGMDKIHPAHQGVILEASGYPYRNLEDILDHAKKRGEPPFVLLLDTLNDPQNFGTLLRTAEAVGVHGVILPLARTVAVTPAVVNASSGASEHLLIAQANLSQAIDQLKEADTWLVGLDEGPDSQLISKIRMDGGGLGIVVGSEGEGIRPLVKSKCDFLARLPMQGKIESLNASVAGSVALYQAYLTRQNL
ncbi:MAG TPA: 23S rRNA (guanosine(2251)-2'-O)-methyltransferase RlmB [Anaerolineales bacterium]|nr:23S rRNA (guanosine(2251)-2'-O)-methyltransferase RlmB [Anaerolineales bacterium]